MAPLVQLERRFAAILPVGKEQIAHVAGRVALGEQGLADEALSVGLELGDWGLGRDRPAAREGGASDIDGVEQPAMPRIRAEVRREIVSR